MSGFASMQLLLLWLPLLLMFQSQFPLATGTTKRVKLSEIENAEPLKQFLEKDVKEWPKVPPTPSVERRVILHILLTSQHCLQGGNPVALTLEDSIKVAYKSCLLSSAAKTALGSDPSTTIAADKAAFEKEYGKHANFKAVYEGSLKHFCPSNDNFYVKVSVITEDTLCAVQSPDVALLKSAYQVMINFALDDFIHRMLSFTLDGMADKADFINFLNGILLTHKFTAATAKPKIEAPDFDEEGRLSYLASFGLVDKLDDLYDKSAAHAFANQMADDEVALKLKSPKMGSLFPLATFNLKDFPNEFWLFSSVVNMYDDAINPLTYKGLIISIHNDFKSSFLMASTEEADFAMSPYLQLFKLVQGKFFIYLAQKFFIENRPKNVPNQNADWPWYYNYKAVALAGIGGVAGVGLAVGGLLYLNRDKSSTSSSALPPAGEEIISIPRGGLNATWIVIIVLVLGVALLGGGFYAYNKYYRGKTDGSASGAGAAGGARGGDDSKKQQPKEKKKYEGSSNTSGAKSSVDSTAAGSSTAS